MLDRTRWGHATAHADLKAAASILTNLITLGEAILLELLLNLLVAGHALLVLL